MAQIIVDVDDLIASDVRDKLTIYWGGPVNGTNPQKMAFLKTYLASKVKREYLDALASIAAQQAEIAARNAGGNPNIT